MIYITINPYNIDNIWYILGYILKNFATVGMIVVISKNENNIIERREIKIFIHVNWAHVCYPQPSCAYNSQNINENNTNKDTCKFISESDDE